MSRKWFGPVSVVIFVLGIAMVVWSTTRGGGTTSSDGSDVGSSFAASSSTSSLMADGSAPMTSVDSTGTDTAGGAVTSPSGASATTVPGPAPATLGAPPSSTPTAPTLRSLPPVSVTPLAPSTTALSPVIPPLAVTPGTVVAPSCSSFADCAQKLFTEWLSGGSGARTRALNYGTSSAVNALFELRTIGVTWGPTVYRSTALKYVASGTVTSTGNSKAIEFVFTSGQSGYKVQSVVWF